MATFYRRFRIHDIAGKSLLGPDPDLGMLEIGSPDYKTAISWLSQIGLLPVIIIVLLLSELYRSLFFLRNGRA